MCARSSLVVGTPTLHFVSYHPEARRAARKMPRDYPPPSNPRARLSDWNNIMTQWLTCNTLNTLIVLHVTGVCMCVRSEESVHLLFNSFPPDSKLKYWVNSEKHFGALLWAALDWFVWNSAQLFHWTLVFLRSVSLVGCQSLVFDLRLILSPVLLCGAHCAILASSSQYWIVGQGMQARPLERGRWEKEKREGGWSYQKLFGSSSEPASLFIGWCWATAECLPMAQLFANLPPPPFPQLAFSAPSCLCQTTPLPQPRH